MSIAHQHQVAQRDGMRDAEMMDKRLETRLEKDTIHHFSSNLSIFPFTLA